MSQLDELQSAIVAFRDERDWEQFHTPKDLAISIAIEAGELLEHFQWKSADEIEERARTRGPEIAAEMADVMNYLLLLAHRLGIDLAEATRLKIKESAAKYPVAKARGRHTKYTEL